MSIRRIASALTFFVIFPIFILEIGAILTPEAAVEPAPGTPVAQVTFESMVALITNLHGLSSTLMSFAVSIIAANGAAIYLNNKLGIYGVDYALSICSISLSFLSIYFGFRFDIDASAQILTKQFSFQLISSRIVYQSLALSFAFSSLLALVSDRHWRNIAAQRPSSRSKRPSK